MYEKDTEPIVEDLQASSSQNNVLESSAGDLRSKSICIRRVTSQSHILSYVDDQNVELPKPKPKRRRSWFKSFQKKKEKEPIEYLHDHLAEALFIVGYNLRNTKLEDILQNDISEEYLKCLHIVSTYTIMNYCGKPSPACDGPHQLASFLSRIIPLTPKDKEKSISIAKSIKPPPYEIEINVIAAKDLAALDASGLSDPFCKIWVKSQENDIKQTEIKKGTLDPEWNESFRFNLTDAKEDTICVQIWDDDPMGLVANLSEMRHIKSLRSCVHFCRDCMESVSSWGRDNVDDFIGKTEIDVKEVYSEGVDEWLPLKDQNGKLHQGELHINIRFEVVRPQNTFDALKRHLLLAKVCLEHGMKLNETSEMSITGWGNILTSSAQTLLFQHSLQGNILAFEDLVCRFVNVVELAMEHISFDFRFLYNILKETHESCLLSANFLGDSLLDDIFKESIVSLDTICLQILSNLHAFDLTENQEKRIQFEFVLRCVSLCQDIAGKTSDLFSTLEAESGSWAAAKGEELERIVNGERADKLLNFLNYFMRYQKAADEVLCSVFPEKTYTDITYEVLDSILSEPIKTNVIKIAEDSLNSKNGDKVEKKKAAFKICINLKRVLDYVCQTVGVSSTELQLGQFLEWFGEDTIKDWFRWKEEITIVQIELIVTGDDLQSKLTICGNRYELHSDSAIVFTGLIQKELYSLWKLVNNDKHPEYNSLFIQGLHNCCMKYAEFLLGLIPIRKLPETFRTGGKRKICAVANNLWSLAMFAYELINQVRIDVSDPNNPQTKYGLQVMCKILCRDIGYKVGPDVAQKIWQVASTESRKEQEKNIRDYVSFMNRLVKVEGNHDMCFEVRLFFISEVWVQVIQATAHSKDKLKVPDPDHDSCINRCRRCLGRNANAYEGLLNVLKESEKFIYLDKDGKMKQALWTDEYVALKSELEQMARSVQ